MTEATSSDLLRAVEGLHNCRATFLRKERVNEMFEGETAWEGSVSVFSVDHPEADTCYAWSSPVEGSDRRKFYAILKKPPVDSPEAAVRASIVRDYRSEEKP